MPLPKFSASSPRVLREAGGVSDAPKDLPVVTPGPLVGVDDPDDPRLDLYRDLNDPAGRIRLDADQSVFVVEGRLAVDRLLTSEYSVRSLLVDDHQVTAASDLVAATRARGAPVFVGSSAVVAGTVGFALHRGVVAVANRPSPAGIGRLLADAAGTSAPEGAFPLVAVLEGLNDHENIGALFRNAAAFGVAGVLLDPTCADPLYRRSIRVSVGHVLHMPFARLVPWPTGLHQVRAAGSSFPQISAEVGIGYSTVRHICQNRAYLGHTRLRDEWFPGAHPPLVTQELFDAAARAHTKGQRRSRDVLSGIVRCGICRRVAGVTYNERNQPLYRCKHRGQGCNQPGRSAKGLHRAAVLGMRVLAEDEDLQQAIRDALASQDGAETTGLPSASSTIGVLKGKLRKLLDLYYADSISDTTFAAEEKRLNAQIASLEDEAARLEEQALEKAQAIEKFAQVSELLASLDLESIWEHATEVERRTLVEDLVDSVHIYPDHLTVQVAGAPPIVVTLAEVGLRAGTKPVVSEGGLELRRQRCRTVVKNPNRLVSSGPGTPPLPIHDGKSGTILGVRWNGGGTGTYLPETDGLHGVLATHRCDCRPPPMATKATARS